MRTLEQCLLDSEPPRLEAIARHWGLESLPAQRRAAVAALAATMQGSDDGERARASLTEEERAALAHLQSADGAVPWPAFTRRWGQVRTMGPGRMAREKPWQDPISPAEGLWYRGFLFRTIADSPAGLHEVAFLPRELLLLLPSLPETSSLCLEPVPVPPNITPATDHFLDDGCTLLAYLQNHRVRARGEQNWPRSDEERLAHQLRDPDPERLSLLRHLADRLGWLRVDRNNHLRPDPDAATAWLQASTAQQRAALAVAWKEDPSWNDLHHVPTLRPDDTGSWRNDPVLAREAILAHLAACQPDAWYSLASFISAVKEVDADFQRPNGDYAAWYIRDAASGAYLSGFDAWDQVEGALIRHLVTGPLHWLGLVDLGSERAGDPDLALRLTADGAAFLGPSDAAPETAQAPPSLTLQPDLTMAVPPARRYERFQLSRIADWVRTNDPFVYRLTASSLERAGRQGITAQRVIAFLEQATEAPLPRTLQSALSGWEQHGVQVRLEKGILLRVGDEKLLQQLAANPLTRRWISEVIGPTAALVAPADWPRLVQALLEEGYLPELLGIEEERAL